MIRVCLASLLSLQLIGSGALGGSISASAALFGNTKQAESSTEEELESSLSIEMPDENKKKASAQTEAKAEVKTDQQAQDADAGEKQEGLVGVWKLTDMSQGGESVLSKEQIEASEKMGIVIYMVFNDDGTVTTMFGEEEHGTWDDSSIIVNETAVAYTLDGDTLTLTGNDDSSMTFERSSQEVINSILGYKEGVLDESVSYAQGEQSILDTDKVAVTVTGYSADKTGFIVKVRTENKTEDPIMITTDSYAINKNMLQLKWAVSLDAGESKESEIKSTIAELEKCGISAADEILLTLKVIDSKTYETLVSGDELIALYPTGKTADQITAGERTPVEGETVLVDNEYCTFVIQGVEYSQGLGYCVNCYFENKTDHALTMMWEKASLNGQETVSFFAEEVLPGARGYDQSVFLKSALDEKQLKWEDITEIGFTLRVYDSSSGSIETLLQEPYTYQVPEKK